MKKTIKKHKIITFCDMEDVEDFRLPQCECGKLASRYYEIVNSDVDMLEMYIADIICEDCFLKWLKKKGIK